MCLVNRTQQKVLYFENGFPDWLRYTMMSCGHAEKDRLLFVAATVIKPSMETGFISFCVKEKA